MKKVNITLTETDTQRISSLYPTQKEGLELCVRNYLTVRDYTLLELKGVFGREELIVLLDIYNGTMYDPTFTGSQFISIQLEDAEKFENAVSRHNADLKTMLEKVNKLTHAQALVLAEECWRFWYASKKSDMDDFLNKML